MRIDLLDTLPPELDAVAGASPRSTFYHTRAWLLSLAESYPRMRLRCLAASDGGSLLAYLPYFEAKRGFLRTLWSLPFGTYGGPVGRDEACVELLRAYRASLSNPGVIDVGCVEFHHSGPAPGWDTSEDSTHVIDIAGGFDAVWRDRFDKPRRRRVRRAQEHGVTVRRGEGADDVARFIDVYRNRLREWDTGRGHPEDLFYRLAERGGDRVRLYLAMHGGMVVGGHLNFYYKEEVIAWYGMTSTQAGETQAGTLLYATCIREACEAGFTSYNLGASLGKRSLIEYKESLGGTARPYRTLRCRRLGGRVAAMLRRGMRAP